MKIESKLIKDLKPATYNPRQISTKQYNDLKASIKKFGLVDPIIVNKDMTVIGGHQRLKICKELKHIEIDCVVLDLSKEEERELNIRLNKNTGDFDMDILANEFDIDELVDWGFKHIDLDINIDKIVEGNTEDDHIPEVKESRVKLGDVWQLGNHRLMCGDSTKESDVAKLMNGQKADMVFTDPPYNIDYKGIKDNRKIKNDKMRDEKFIEFLYNSLNINTDTFYVCCSWQYCHLFKQVLEELKKPVKSFIVWNKVNPAQHLDKYFKQHEIILYHGKFGGQKTLRGDIWEVKRERNTVHPTMKPISLIQIAIEDNNKKKLIYDPFLGSGSTLIACEKTNRTCYGMELDTKYCDVIIERWEQFTGQKAKKCG